MATDADRSPKWHSPAFIHYTDLHPSDILPLSNKSYSI